MDELAVPMVLASRLFEARAKGDGSGTREILLTHLTQTAQMGKLDELRKLLRTELAWKL